MIGNKRYIANELIKKANSLRATAEILRCRAEYLHGDKTFALEHAKEIDIQAASIYERAETLFCELIQNNEPEEERDWVCEKCGLEHGRNPAGEGATWHMGKCEACGDITLVTEQRDFLCPTY